MSNSNEKPSSGSSRGQIVRDQIQANYDAQLSERKRELFRKRLELARSGVDKFRDKDATKSATNFHTYVRILEEFKGVPEGGLNPNQFDRKTELSEILLLSGIYWDLVKLYDRTKSADRYKDFAHYLEQFIKFSKDMPHQYVSAETLRKYMSMKRANHKDELKNAYRLLNKSNCFVVSALVMETRPETVEILREWRDEKLERSRWGQAYIRFYYENGPRWAEWVDQQPSAVRKAIGVGIDLFAQVVLFISGPFRSDQAEK